MVVLVLRRQEVDQQAADAGQSFILFIREPVVCQYFPGIFYSVARSLP